MSIPQKIENYYKNILETIKKAKIIKALICELGRKGITVIARMLGMAFETVKSYYLTDYENIQLKEEKEKEKR